MTSSDHIHKTHRFGVANYAPLPVVLTRGRGVWVWDVAGQKYLDCLSAYSAVSQGHCHPHIYRALKNQARKLTLPSRAFMHDQMPVFLERLTHFCGYEKALLMNSGTEAVETAIKLVRKWGYQIKKTPQNKAEIIVCSNNFHGRSTTIVGFSTMDQYKKDFGPYDGGFKTVPFGDAKALEAAITPNTVAFLMEPIQGEGGIYVPPQGYYKAIQDICRNHKILWVADEIQTGLGRTGRMFAYQHEEGVRPDVLLLGKALSGGYYPVSAVLADDDIFKVIRPGDHGSTFGGNPLACVVGMAALEVIEAENLAHKAQVMGQELMDRLKALDSPLIKEVRGRGLLIGVEFHKHAGTAHDYVERMLEEGVLMKETRPYVLRLAPPLVLGRTHIDTIVRAFKRVLARNQAS